VDCKFGLAGCFVSGGSVKGQSQDKYSLQLQGFVWSRSTLNALVVTADNESWWEPAFLNTASPSTKPPG